MDGRGAGLPGGGERRDSLLLIGKGEARARELETAQVKNEMVEAEEREAIAAASEELALHFRKLIDTDEVDSIKHIQHLILGRLQDSNAVVSHFNELSERCYGEVSGEFVRNTKLLKSMKSDLDYIFFKLRNMKSKLQATYPDAFPDSSTAKMIDQRPDLESPLQ